LFRNSYNIFIQWKEYSPLIVYLSSREISLDLHPLRISFLLSICDGNKIATTLSAMMLFLFMKQQFRLEWHDVISSAVYAP